MKAIDLIQGVLVGIHVEVEFELTRTDSFFQLKLSGSN